MHIRADRCHRIGPDLRKLRADRMRERHVRRETAAEKCADAAVRAIEELIGHDDVERRIFVLQAANGTGRDDPVGTKQLEPEDVRAKVELRRQQAMARPVSREKCDALAAERADQIRSRRVAERRLQRFLFSVGQLGHVVQATAADDTYLNSHESPMVHRSPFTVYGKRSMVNAHATLSIYRFPSFSRMYPAAMSGSCSNTMRYSRSMASRRKVR